jgi:hypothetical protein
MKELSISCTVKYYFSLYVPSTTSGQNHMTSKIEEARLFKHDQKLRILHFEQYPEYKGGVGPVCNLFWPVKTRNAEEETDILPLVPYF